MFLPVLLMRDYGAAGWWVFTIPNVVGAALMGWTIRSRTLAGEVADAHATAGIAFSIVTVGFHLFFTCWLIRLWWGNEAIVVVLGLSVAVFAAITFLSFADRLLSIAALVVSAAVWSGLADYGTVAVFEPRRVVDHNLLPLATVCAFGFALCPYLDLTFLRARRAMADPDDARAAFTIGFVGLFAPMICLTAAYAAPMWYVLQDGYFSLSNYITRAVTIHLVAQSSLTIAFHARESFARRGALRATSWLVVVLGFVAVSVGAELIDPLSRWRGMNSGEVCYRIFMGFYALVFPAYVWLCMIPGRGRTAPTRRQWAVWAIAVAVAAPMFWMGFIERRMMWVLPGVAIVLIARLFVSGEEDVKLEDMKT